MWTTLSFKNVSHFWQVKEQPKQGVLSSLTFGFAPDCMIPVKIWRFEGVLRRFVFIVRLQKRLNSDFHVDLVPGLYLCVRLSTMRYIAFDGIRMKRCSTSSSSSNNSSIPVETSSTSLSENHARRPVSAPERAKYNQSYLITANFPEWCTSRQLWSRIHFLALDWPP